MDEQAADPWSATTLDIQRQLQALRETGETGAIATVVGVEGSAYRRPGAKMVMTPGGDQLGGITAGCLEGPVINIADRVFEDGEPVLETFDLMDDDEWGLGLGCNGIIDILVEPVDSNWDPVVAALEAGESVATVTAVDGPVPLGSRTVLDESGDAITGGDRGPVPDAVLESVRSTARSCAGSGGTAIETVTYEGETVRVFVDGIQPPSKLLVFGGQPDTTPVTRLARQAGFHVRVATARGAQADPERFPAAHEVFTTRPHDLGDHVDERTYVVLMSHNLLDDELALADVLDSPTPYVGLMGPRSRFEKIRDDLADEGVEFSEDQLNRIATPVGLDLGGGEPIEIAMSIVSEVIAVQNDRDGGRLCDREGPIHGEREVAADD